MKMEWNDKTDSESVCLATNLLRKKSLPRWRTKNNNNHFYYTNRPNTMCKFAVYWINILHTVKMKWSKLFLYVAWLCACTMPYFRCIVCVIDKTFYPCIVSAVHDWKLHAPLLYLWSWNEQQRQQRPKIKRLIPSED